VSCSCGAKADYRRMRCAHVRTVLGTVTLKRPYYLCGSCRHGQAPLDQQLGFCAGGLSAGLSEILALMGAQGPFEEAVELIRRLTLVEVCPNSCKEATEMLGHLVGEQERQQVKEAWDVQHFVLPSSPEDVPQRLYVSIDGTLVHTREEGWKEMKLGTFYTTSTVVPKERPQQQGRLEIRAQNASFYADFAIPEDFGRALWLEGHRRGATQTHEIVAIGDGAQWIWKLVEEHFPSAIQIVDWYHAASYIWKVANAVYGEGSDLGRTWAKKRLDELWNGQLDALLQRLEDHTSASETVHQAITYYTNNRARMRYPEYRAQGLQIGSGTIESGCKHVIGARLKQAGMIWSLEGARAVAKVRTRIKSRRWEETIAQRPPPYRSYHRQAA
jgi:hypothetical protein